MAARKSTRKKSAKPVWKRAAPAKAPHTHLSATQKSRARARAQRAGHPYPNLVDNIQAARTRR